MLARLSRVLVQGPRTRALLVSARTWDHARTHKTKSAPAGTIQTPIGDLGPRDLQRTRSLFRSRLGKCCRHGMLGEALEVAAIMEENNIDLGPVEYERLLFVCSTNGAVEDAERIAASMDAKKISLSEAGHSVMITMHARRGDVQTALHWFERLCATEGLPRRLRHYSPLLQVCGSTRNTALGFQLLERARNDGLIPDQESLVSLLQSAAAEADPALRALGAQILAALREYSMVLETPTLDAVTAWFQAGGVGASQEPGPHHWTMTRAYVSSSGLCSGCGVKLESVELKPDRQLLLKKEVERLLIQSCTPSAFKRFQEFLKMRGPVDAVVDGLNVAHALSTVPNSQLVKEMVEYLESCGKNVLVFGRSHCFVKERMSPGEKVWHNLWEQNKAWVVPTWGADDLFWLYTAIVHGMDVDLITNDEMTDHKQLIDPALDADFERWRRGHQLRFEFNRLSPVLQPKQQYDPVVQWAHGGNLWHFPAAQSVEWLCVHRGGK